MICTFFARGTQIRTPWLHFVRDAMNGTIQDHYRQNPSKTSQGVLLRTACSKPNAMMPLFHTVLCSCQNSGWNTAQPDRAIWNENVYHHVSLPTHRYNYTSWRTLMYHFIFRRTDKEKGRESWSRKSIHSSCLHFSLKQYSVRSITTHTFLVASCFTIILQTCNFIAYLIM